MFFCTTAYHGRDQTQKIQNGIRLFKEAFGVQRQVEQQDMPKAESVIKEEWSSGPPTPIKSDTVNQPLQIAKPGMEKIQEENKENEESLKNSLKQEMQKEDIEIVKEGNDIVIRVSEKASFASGSAALQKAFIPTLMKLVRKIKPMDYSIEIAGHTDNVPISSKRYRSNWELSSSRAVTMAHALMKAGDINPTRITVRGHADTKPLVPNTSRENQARNRRVEIVLKNNKLVQ